MLVADRRFCPLLPPALALAPTPGLAAVPGAANQSCTEVCAAQGAHCSLEDFWWVNRCVRPGTQRGSGAAQLPPCRPSRGSASACSAVLRPRRQLCAYGTM